ncbi:hypothetical protein KCU62_g155, partial [Aureobasidium sp. EXF-3399]
MSFAEDFRSSADIVVERLRPTWSAQSFQRGSYRSSRVFRSLGRYDLVLGLGILHRAAGFLKIGGTWIVNLASGRDLGCSSRVFHQRCAWEILCITVFVVDRR